MSIGADSVNQQNSQRAWADWVGMTASIGCAIHCAAMPLVIAYLPVLGLSWLADELFHQWMALVCFILAVLAFLPGWRKHQSLIPMLLGTAGVLLLTTSAFALECECCPSNDELQKEEIDSSCSDPNCSACEKEVPKLESSGSHTMLESIVPFVTPTGGMLLVIGHVANHRKSGACQGESCCVDVPNSEPAE